MRGVARESVNFNTVAAEARVSKGFLYGNNRWEFKAFADESQLFAST
jgi:hypothetical protein